MGLELFALTLVCIVGVLAYGSYENKKKYELKVKEVELEKEKVILEQKRLDYKEKIDK